jgi:NAD(P)-dependent dehydrogenase (short-subunit alcohol dehydrogenase family)
MANGRLKGRIALITGASRGIGAAVARRFAAEGAELILVARTVGGLEELDDQVRALGGHALLVPLDLKEGALIDQLGAALYQRYGRLDILVGNAAILGELRPTAHYTPEQWADTLAVNVTANWRLIRSLDALLRTSDAGRAIFVTAPVARVPRAYWAAYAASKAALDALVFCYASETERTNLRVNLIEPAKVATRLRKEAYPDEDRSLLKSPDAIAELFVRLAEVSYQGSGERLSV